MQRPMKLAVGIPAIDDVDALWCPMVSLARFGADRLPTQRDLIGP
jgi:hypothetical protein